ncbi:MAG: hypothetical protein ACI91O_000450 [Candidatus Poriferisodalaceae bacterium]|jgi:hypothetical protein
MSVSPISAAPSVRFAVTARALCDVARRAGLSIPGYRTPPRVAGLDRSIRRTDRGVVVSVRVKGRPFVAVVADMIEGVVATNSLTGADAGRCRSMLWDEITALEEGADDAVVRPAA